MQITMEIREPDFLDYQNKVFYELSKGYQL